MERSNDGGEMEDQAALLEFVVMGANSCSRAFIMLLLVGTS